MAHHQGMVIVAIANVVHDGAMRARFRAEPMVGPPSSCFRNDATGRGGRAPRADEVQPS